MSSAAYMYIKYTYSLSGAGRSRTGLWCNLDLFTIVDVSDGNFKIHQLFPWCFILLYAYLNEVHYAQVQNITYKWGVLGDIDANSNSIVYVHQQPVATCYTVINGKNTTLTEKLIPYLMQK